MENTSVFVEGLNYYFVVDDEVNVIAYNEVDKQWSVWTMQIHNRIY